MPQKDKTFLKAILVYLLASHASSLQTRAIKFQQHYGGSLVIDTVLDSTHFILRDLESGVLLYSLYIHRLKLSFESTTSGTANIESYLTNAIQGTNTTNSTDNTANNIKSIQR